MDQKDIRAGVLYLAESPAVAGGPLPVVFLADHAAAMFEYLGEDETDPAERPGGWPVRRLGKGDFFGAGRKRRSAEFCGSAAVTGPAEDLERLDCEDELSRFEQGWPPSRPGLRWTLIASTSAVKGPAAAGPGQLYHGTRSVLYPGETLTPEDAARHPNNPEIGEEPYVHAAADPAEAARWGERADPVAAGRRMRELGRQQPDRETAGQEYPPRVYLVEAAGDVEPDLVYASTEPGSWRSAQPMRVIREVTPLECDAPEHQRAEEHWPGHPHYQWLEDEQRELGEDDEPEGDDEPPVLANWPEDPDAEDTAEAPADSYPPDVEFMETADIGKLTSDLEPGMTVEERYQKLPEKRRDDTQARLDKAIAEHGWQPSPLEILNGDRLTDGHHTYAAARDRGVSQLPVRHYRRTGTGLGAGGEETHTHGQWMTVTATLITRLDEIPGQVDGMYAGLTCAAAGRDQVAGILALGAACHAWRGQVTAMLGQVNTAALPVAEAYTAAGGQAPQPSYFASI